MHVINTLAPIVLIILLGHLLRRFGFAGGDFFRAINRLVYWVGLPCLLFTKTGQPEADLGPGLKLSLVLIGGMVVSMAFAGVAARLGSVPRRSRGAFVQGTFRGNLAYVGLPVVLFALSANHGTAPPVVATLAAVSLAPLVPLYNVAAAILLLAGRRAEPTGGRHPTRTLVLSVATNPLVLACAAGLLFAAAGWRLPVAAGRALSALGQMALPLSLLSVGAALGPEALRGNLTHAVTASLLKVAVAPLALLAVRPWLALSGAELTIALIYLAAPTAVSSYVMTEQLGGDDELAGSIVVMSTLLSMPAFAIILAALQ